MKVLLAVMMTMLIGSSAFAADVCSVKTPTACEDEKSCTDLPATGAKKWTWNPLSKGVKCISGDGAVVSDCTEISNANIVDRATGSQSDKPGTAKGFGK